MSNWRTEKLRTLGEFRSAGADKLSQPGELPIKLVNYMDVYHQHRIHSGMEFQQVTATEGEIRRCDLKRNDVLFTPSSETPDDIAHAAVVAEDLPGTIYSYHLVRFRLNDSTKFDTDFLGYLFNQPDVYRYFWARASGLTRFTLNRADFNGLSIRYPDCPKEQKVIADVLSVVDKALGAALTCLKKADRLQIAMMRELLSGRMKLDGSLRQADEYWNHEKVGPVPHGWIVEPLKQLASIQRGRFSHRPRNDPKFFGGAFPFIQTADIVSSRGYIRTHSQSLNEDGLRISRMFPAGTILITIAANIGNTAIASYDVCATDSVIGITPNNGVDPEYLELCMRCRRAHLDQVSTESAQKNINYGNLRPLLITIPKDVNEQRMLARAMLDIEDFVISKARKVEALQRLKKSLMQHLLTGKIRLPVPDETPAPIPT